MKKSILSRFFLICSLCILMSSARAQYVSIPDSNFGNWLFANGYDSCLTGNSISGYRLDTTCSDVLHAYIINCASDSIADLTGIRYFKNLATLLCERNNLTSLPTLPPALYSLDCGFNQLTSISSMPTTLVQLDCPYNLLTSLPPLPASLRTIYCNNNQLTSIPALPTPLQELICSNNNLTALPALADSLVTLDCSTNQLTSLPALPQVLQFLRCYSNQLTSMPTLPDSLRVLNTSSNHLSILPSLPPLIYNLDCSYNLLTALPSMPAPLVTLYCAHNQITALPTLTDTLVDLNCSYNLLTALPPMPFDLLDLNCVHNLNLTCLPIFYQSSLNNFYIDSTSIQCIPQRLTAQYFDMNPDSMRVCDSTGTCPYISTVNTGINQINNVSIISLYPNPNKGTFTLQTSGSIGSSYVITDMLGHIISQQSITADRQGVDMRESAEGVYTLTVKGTQPLRFTVMK